MSCEDVLIEVYDSKGLEKVTKQRKTGCWDRIKQSKIIHVLASGSMIASGALFASHAFCMTEIGSGQVDERRKLAVALDFRSYNKQDRSKTDMKVTCAKWKEEKQKKPNEILRTDCIEKAHKWATDYRDYKGNYPKLTKYPAIYHEAIANGLSI